MIIIDIYICRYMFVNKSICIYIRFIISFYRNVKNAESMQKSIFILCILFSFFVFKINFNYKFYNDFEENTTSRVMCCVVRRDERTYDILDILIHFNIY